MLNQFWAGEIPLFVVHRYKLLSDTRYGMVLILVALLQKKCYNV